MGLDNLYMASIYSVFEFNKTILIVIKKLTKRDKNGNPKVNR